MNDINLLLDAVQTTNKFIETNNGHLKALTSCLSLILQLELDNRKMLCDLSKIVLKNAEKP